MRVRSRFWSTTAAIMALPTNTQCDTSLSGRALDNTGNTAFNSLTKPPSDRDRGGPEGRLGTVCVWSLGPVTRK
jgi:hypothetical protein